MKFDLHIHTNFSDGILMPHEVVDLAKHNNLDGIAITDHDTIFGIDEAINRGKSYDDFYIIPGIEFGSIYNGEDVHILGYFIDYKNEELIETIDKLVNSRINRAKKIIEKLNELGVRITLEDVKEHTNKKNIGRPHIARAMIDKNYVETISEAFDKYLDRGKPAYVERLYLSIDETIKLIRTINGISVLAHPGLLKDREIIDYCVVWGIDGIECIHPKHSKEEIEQFTKIANKNDLIITGGSDFHGDADRTGIGKFFVDLNDVPEMRRRLKNV
jgi:hypothetical protein